MKHLLTGLQNGNRKTQNRVYIIGLIVAGVLIAAAHFFFGLTFKIN